MPHRPPGAASLPHRAASSQNVNASLFLFFPLVNLFLTWLHLHARTSSCSPEGICSRLASTWQCRENKRCFSRHCVYSLNTRSSSVSSRAFGARHEGSFPSLISRIWSASGKHSSLCMPCILVTEGQLLWDGWYTELSLLQMMTGKQHIFKKQEFLQCSHHSHLRSPVPPRRALTLV